MDLVDDTSRLEQPLQCAATQTNLGTALRTLGERESGTARLEEAKRAIQAAYGVYRDAGYARYRAYFEERVTSIEQPIEERSP